MKIGKVLPAEITQEMRKNYLDYAMSVIVARALPDVRDGLKPVHRRILYAMHDMGLRPTSAYAKSAKVVGETMGKYHPHGDGPIYDAIVRLAQNFSMRYMLVDGQGNFGCFTKDTKVKLADGRDLSFGELINEHKQGKKNYTYTVNNSGLISIAEIKEPRLTIRDAEVIKITLDNGEVIKCTPNHLFMLKDGSYKEAQSLMKTDSLMPHYQRLSQTTDRLNREGYALIFQNKTTNNTGRLKFLNICKEVVKKFSTLNEEHYNKLRNEIYPYGSAPYGTTGLKNYFSDNPDMVRLEINGNHKVIDIENLTTREDMYDLTIDNYHNFALAAGVFVHNSVDGDPAAAMRYTEVRPAKISEELLRDIEKETVEFEPNFDSTLREPKYLPSLLPNLLLMGAEGIAVGMATKIPPHNLSEVVDAAIATIEKGKSAPAQTDTAEFVIKKIDLAVAAGKAGNLDQVEIKAPKMEFNSDITVEDLTAYIKGPDFPTGGLIYGGKYLPEVYGSGRGRIIVRGVAKIEDTGKKSRIVITELPYQVNKASLVIKIAELARDKKIAGISDLRDESDRRGMSVVIELKKDARPKAVLNNLYKHTDLQTSFPANFVALVNGIPKTLNLKQILVEYVRHRQEVVARRSLFDLTEAKRRAHILEGLKIALDNLDAVIKTIRESRDTETARINLIDRFGLTEIQANAILDMQLRRLSALEREKIEEEYKKVGEIIDFLADLLMHPEKILAVIKTELVELKEKYGDARRTKIVASPVGEISEEDLVAQEEVIVTITRTGYIKRLPPSTYRAQRRGGVGVVGMTTKEEDEISHIFSATTHDSLMFFTNKGRVFGVRVWEIPEGSRQSKGQAIVNLINIDRGEQVEAVLTLPKANEAKYMVLTTRKGVVKRTALEEFKNLRASGLIAIRLDKDDDLVWARPTDGKGHVILVTQKGKCIRFSENDARPLGRPTRGVRGITLNGPDEVIGMEAVPEKLPENTGRRKKIFRDILVVMERGLGKRAPIQYFPLQKRGGMGVKVAELTDKTGDVSCARLVTEDIEQIIITSRGGQIIKLPLKNIPQLGRATQGVILMRFGKDKTDRVAAVAALPKDDESGVEENTPEVGIPTDAD
ncbi:MAG: hypothetical protein A2782_01600 [Candidatus Blackburnbacteria bacterium RIFCSPHIGHO2_01_FULL_43_15b]|uniref:DNA topoisomerase (ATP-hydrolyzing) n=1 Tax=Candidatus Blackburnbacteria bacterium RIFCSPHIGHO2_01_FULL_43_15b TaxID=1797513 RepID=A0A1G1UXH2_9BACT|nr:MAG: hypothetical protein A2782_01600 [Candidatus Blackburnbacteria bacterium RIFCSPHIGHO2_01_FULL_43_15b]